MKAAVLERFGHPLRVTDVPEPSASDGEVIVRVKACGLCRSDLHLIDGALPIALPRILGHEIAGEAPGIGDVLVLTNWGCGDCQFCIRGEAALCPLGVEAGWTEDGGYAEFVRVPDRRFILPLEGLDPVAAAPLGDAGITPFRAVNKLRPWLESSCSVLIIGAGGLGQFAIQYVRLLAECEVVVVDTNPAQIVRALALGADRAFSPAEVSKEQFRAVLDLVGTKESLSLAAGAVERDGVVVLVGEEGGQVSFGHSVVPMEATFRTSISGSRDDALQVLSLARQGRLTWDVEPIPLPRINEAIDRLRQGDARRRFVVIP
jgi:propanol-preferring alcohol dehydrogenase